MRVAPISLFFYQNYDQLVKMAKSSAEITHSHKLGVDGAILQAVAVHQSLEVPSNSSLDTKEFIAKLIEKMSAIEKDDEGFVHISLYYYASVPYRDLIRFMYINQLNFYPQLTLSE